MNKAILNLKQGLEGGLWVKRTPEAMSAPHIHEELEFNIITRGSACYIMDRRSYTMGARSMVWLFPEQNHILIDISEDIELWVIVFRPSILEKAKLSGSFTVLRERDPLGNFCRQISDAASRELQQLLLTVESSSDEPACFNAGLTFLLLTAWRIFERSEHIEADVTLHPAVARALSALQNGKDDTSIDQLALQSGLSPSQLSRLFHRQVGSSIVKLRNRLRLERFFRIYGTGQRTTMLNAALDAGFGSYAQFHRIFRDETGAGPQIYFARPAAAEPDPIRKRSKPARLNSRVR